MITSAQSGHRLEPSLIKEQAMEGKQRACFLLSSGSCSLSEALFLLYLQLFSFVHPFPTTHRYTWAFSTLQTKNETNFLPQICCSLEVLFHFPPLFFFTAKFLLKEVFTSLTSPILYSLFSLFDPCNFPETVFLKALRTT